MNGNLTEVEKAIIKLDTEYTDFYGRTTLSPAKGSDPQNGRYDSENNGLWTGEAAILLKLHNSINGRFWSRQQMAWCSVQVTDENDEPIPGLYSRHPHPHWLDPNHHIVSWDEYNGLMYSMIAICNEQIPREVISYGRRHLYSYVDGFKGVGWKKRWELYWRGLRQPRDFFFFKIAAGKKPNLLETINAAVAHVLTSRKPHWETSGKMMAWFKKKAIEIKGYKGWIWRMADGIFDKNLKKMYGDKYVEVMARIYYRDKNHPFHALLKDQT